MGKRKTKGTTEPILTINHAMPTTGDEGLDALMSALGDVPNDVTLPEGNENVVDAALEALEEIIEEGTTTDETPPAIEAKGEAAVVETIVPETIETQPETTAAPATEAPTKKGKLTDEEKAARKAAREAAAKERSEKREAERAAAPPKPKRQFFGKNNLGRMTAAMGEDTVRSTMIFTTDEAAGDVKAVTDANLAAFKGLSIKVQRRATYILEFVHRNGSGKLSEIVRRGFEVLHRDGKIESGEKGNFALDLLARPYDMGTVRAAGMNSLAAMKALKIVVAAPEKQTYVINPASTLAGKVNKLLGLTK